MKKRFTEEGVAKLRPPPSSRVEYGHAYMSGLMPRVTANGVKTWSVLYKVSGETSGTIHGYPGSPVTRANAWLACGILAGAFPAQESGLQRGKSGRRLCTCDLCTL